MIEFHLAVEMGSDQWLSLAMKAMVELQMMVFLGVGGVDVDGGWWIIILYWYRGLSGQYKY